MKKSRILYSAIAMLFGVIAILFGVFMVVYGEYDDSPGGQLLGLTAVITGIIGLIKSKKRLFS